MAIIAGLPKAPSTFNPLYSMDRATARRNVVLARMLSEGYITQTQYDQARNEAIDARYHAPEIAFSAPYLSEMVRQEMVNRYGEQAYEDGYRVYTTITRKNQQSAQQAVRNNVLDYDMRHGYRGPESRLPGKTRAAWLQELNKQRSMGGLDPAIVTQVTKDGIQVLTRSGEAHVAWDSMKWARPYLNTNSLGARPRQPADVVQVGDLIRVQRQADGQSQDWLLVIQREGGGIRWSMMDPLGIPQARQLLDGQQWQADGLLPPNPAARELFAAAPGAGG